MMCKKLKRIFYFFIFVIFSHFFLVSPVFGQDTDTNGEKIKMIDFLENLSRLHNWNFLYNPTDITGNIERSYINEVQGSIQNLNEIIQFKGIKAHLVESNYYAIVPIIKSKSGDQKRSDNVIVRGKVIDSEGKVLAGVSILDYKKNVVGTTTDINGRYIIEVQNSSILEFSMVGFETQQIHVNDNGIIDVKLLKSLTKLDDVVVVAFGQQKKQEVVGAMTTITPSDLKIPSSNLTTAFAGRIAGLISYQRSGEPGLDNADFFIRGVTTFGFKKDPLILIDGIELTTTDLARLQPDDISSFSIMKDATATALYGARGANGVILVKTKEGKEGRALISMRTEASMSKPTKDVKLADPITYMELHNEAVLTRDPLGILPYSQSKIDNTIAGKNPYVYPATDWKDALIKDQTFTERANLSVSGGGKVARYYVAGSFSKDNGILNVDKRNNFNNNIDLKSYLLRSNVNIEVTKTTEMVVRLHGSFDDYTGPIDGGEGAYRKIMRTNPVLFPQYFPILDDYKYVNHILFGNASVGDQFYINPYADLVKGYKDYSRSLMLAQIELKQNLNFITPGLSFRILGNTNRTSYFDVSRAYSPFFYQSDFFDPRTGTYKLALLNENSAKEYLDYAEGAKQVSSEFYLESALNYSKNFNKDHNLGALLVYTMKNSLYGNAGDIQQSLPFRNIGLSGRATYSLFERYFAEFNFGYNGSERFYKTNRFGFFPSVGIGWTVSKEKFWEPVSETITFLKLRCTYGLVGNDAIGSAKDRFFYLSNVDMNDKSKGFTFGSAFEEVIDGISISRYSNRDITWETSLKSNLGIELKLFNKLGVEVDLYKEYRKNILMTRSSIPTTMGLQSDIRANVGEASGKGVDVSLDYVQEFNSNFWVRATTNFTYATSKYEVFEEPSYDEPWLYKVGYPLSQEWGYIAERLFVDDYEALNSPLQNFGVYQGGDIKYRDINYDGKVSTLDQVPIGYPTMPEIVYGFGASLGYKSFDFSFFFQGLGRESFWINPKSTAPFINYKYENEALNAMPQNQLLDVYAKDHWSERDPNIYAIWPRLSSIVNVNNSQKSTWFMRDGSFLRLKSVELGYSLPFNLIDKISIKTARFYLSGINLLTFSNFKLWDVEMAGNGLGYPIQKVYNLGIRVTF